MKRAPVVRVYSQANALASGAAGANPQVLFGPIDVRDITNFTFNIINCQATVIPYTIQVSPFSDNSDWWSDITASSLGDSAVVRHDFTNNYHMYMRIMASATAIGSCQTSLVITSKDQY
jgi:hypothetical protein